MTRNIDIQVPIFVRVFLSQITLQPITINNPLYHTFTLHIHTCVRTRTTTCTPAIYRNTVMERIGVDLSAQCVPWGGSQPGCNKGRGKVIRCQFNHFPIGLIIIHLFSNYTTATNYTRIYCRRSFSHFGIGHSAVISADNIRPLVTIRWLFRGWPRFLMNWGILECYICHRRRTFPKLWEWKVLTRHLQAVKPLTRFRDILFVRSDPNVISKSKPQTFLSFSVDNQDTNLWKTEQCNTHATIVTTNGSSNWCENVLFQTLLSAN